MRNVLRNPGRGLAWAVYPPEAKTGYEEPGEFMVLKASWWDAEQFASREAAEAAARERTTAARAAHAAWLARLDGGEE